MQRGKQKMAVWNIRGVPEELARCVKSTAAARGVTLAGLVIETMAREVSSPAKKIADISAGGVIDPELVELHREIGENAVRSILTEIRGESGLPRGGKAQDAPEYSNPLLNSAGTECVRCHQSLDQHSAAFCGGDDGAAVRTESGNGYTADRAVEDMMVNLRLSGVRREAREDDYHARGKVMTELYPGEITEPKLEEIADGAKGRGKVGKGVRGVGRSPVTVAQGTDGPEGDSVGIGKPSVDMEALRDICAGKGIRPAPLSVEPIEVDLGGFKSYNETDGENYVCGKEKHGPKVNHGEWIKI